MLLKTDIYFFIGPVPPHTLSIMDSSRTRALQHAHTLIMHPLLVLPHSLGGGVLLSLKHNDEGEREKKKRSYVIFFNMYMHMPEKGWNDQTVPGEMFSEGHS